MSLPVFYRIDWDLVDLPDDRGIFQTILENILAIPDRVEVGTAR